MKFDKIKEFLSNRKILAVAAVAILLVIAFAVSSAQSQPAQPQCGKREIFVQSLNEDYKENRVAVGLGRNNVLMELYVSKESGSWTVLGSSANGEFSCIIADGQAFQIVDEELFKEDPINY